MVLQRSLTGEQVILVPPSRKQDLLDYTSCIVIQGEACDGWQTPHEDEAEMLQAFLKGGAARPKGRWMTVSDKRVGENETGVYIHWNHHKRYFGIPRANASVALRLAVPEAVPLFTGVKEDGSLLSKVMTKMPAINDEMRHQVLHAAFVSADLNKNGTLSRPELGTLLRRVVCFLKQSDVSELMVAADENADKKIQYKEFTDWMKRSAPPNVKAALRSSLDRNEDIVKATFRLWDQNGDGLIAKHELSKVLRKLCVKSKFSQEQLIALINVMDTDHNGKVDYDEFVDFLFGGRRAQQTAKGE